MIPLALVAGFLGSGKTTFLRRMSERNDGRRLAFLVNDFAAVDVDAQLLSQLDGEIVSIPGGSIFCRCLATTFTNALKKIARLEPAVDGVIIEASGMADPRSLADVLRETRLDELYELSTVVSLVDPGTFRKLLKTLPAMRAQVECADVVLLNKTDLFDEATVQATEEAIRSVRGEIQIARCVRGDAPVQFFQGISHALKIHGSLSPCRDDSFLSATFRFRAKCNIGDIAELLNRYSHILWRAKGFVPTDAGLMELHWTMRSDKWKVESGKWKVGTAAPTAQVPAEGGKKNFPLSTFHFPLDGGHLDIQPATAPTARPALVLIARGDAEEELGDLVADLRKTH